MAVIQPVDGPSLPVTNTMTLAKSLRGSNASISHELFTINPLSTPCQCSHPVDLMTVWRTRTYYVPRS
jgi:hypothetical protein